MSLNIITGHGSGTLKGCSIQLVLCADSVAAEWFLSLEEAESIVRTLNEAIAEGRKEHKREKRKFLRRNPHVRKGVQG